MSGETLKIYKIFLFHFQDGTRQCVPSAQLLVSEHISVLQFRGSPSSFFNAP